MEDSLQIVLYVVIVAASLAGSIIKKARKNAAAKDKPAKQPAWEWTTVDTEEEEVQWPVRTVVPVEIPAYPGYGQIHPDSKELIEPSSNTFAAEKIIHEGGRTTDHKKDKPKKYSHTDNHKHPEEVGNGILDDFDLSKAVIYYEILQPKHKEY